MSTPQFTVDVPGAFHTFLSGTGTVAGQQYATDPDLERGAQELCAAYKDSIEIRRGRGYSLRLNFPSVHAVVVLAEYAQVCISANYGGDVDYSEVAAARAVLERCEIATGGRVTYDGWNVRLDGEVPPL